jgi:FKBP-type peptidyl-prolyl cis-trans isomerase
LCVKGFCIPHGEKEEDGKKSKAGGEEVRWRWLEKNNHWMTKEKRVEKKKNTKKKKKKKNTKKKKKKNTKKKKKKKKKMMRMTSISYHPVQVGHYLKGEGLHNRSSLEYPF